MGIIDAGRLAKCAVFSTRVSITQEHAAIQLKARPVRCCLSLFALRMRGLARPDGDLSRRWPEC